MKIPILLALALATATLASTQSQQPTTPTQSSSTAAAELQTVVIKVTDASGVEVARAPVTITPSPAQAPENMLTDDKGELRLHLQPGSYSLIVHQPGFKKLSTNMDVKAGEQAQIVPVVLQIAMIGGLPVYGMNTLCVLIDSKQVAALVVEDLQTLPRRTVVVRNPHSNADEKYEGVLLADLLSKYGAPLGKDLRGPALANYVVTTGADGYKVVYSLAELDPTFHPGDVIIADTMDGKPLDSHAGPFRLVSTEDKRPARGVRNLVSIELKSAP